MISYIGGLHKSHSKSETKISDKLSIVFKQITLKREV